MPGTFERWVERKVPAAEILVDDRPYLPGPRIGRIDRPLIANLRRHADAHRPMPRVGHAHPGPDMVPHPLHSMAVLPAGKNIKAHFRPAGQPLSDLERLVQLVVGGIHAVDHILLSVRGVVGMEFNHGALWFYGGRSIDLNFVVALGVSRQRTAEQNENPEIPRQITHSERAS